ncbi:MAG: hypothetical protein RR470_09945 [Vagococcus sp.]|uniref:hypothetical protein n=1 Tax=Vagococcus sp. TaxID=1933889 RepID=UPI002FC5A46E
MLDLVLGKGYLLLFGAIYLWILHKLTLNTRFTKFFMIYGSVVQLVFLVYYFYTTNHLMNYPDLPITMSVFNTFGDRLAICYVALILPIYGLILFKLYKKMSKLLLTVIAIALLPICYILLIIFILLTYGFAP